MLVVCGEVSGPEIITTSANQIVLVKFHGGTKMLYYIHYIPPFLSDEGLDMRLCRVMVDWQDRPTYGELWTRLIEKWTDLFQQAIEDRGGILQPVTFIHNEALPWKPVKQ